MSPTYIPVELRRLVRERASDRCEFCCIPEAATFAPLEVDHVVAEKHDGPTEASNLCLCCTVCNKHKGSDLTSIDPHTGEIVALFHPRRDQWRDHFVVRESRIEPLTSIGRVTVKLLQFNRLERVKEREALTASGLFVTPVE